MIIEDIEAFKTWLTAVLKPICEADPGALAKYVIALVKKDKSPEAMRQSMVNQLEVFLQNETEQFVNQLFRTLETQDYITPVIPNANPPNPNTAEITTNLSNVIGTSEVKIQKAVTIIPVTEIAANLSETLNGKSVIVPPSSSSSSSILQTTSIAPTIKDEKKDLSIPISATVIKDEKPRHRSRRRSSSRNRSRSRSWDRDRTKRGSRSREKSRDRGNSGSGGAGGGGLDSKSTYRGRNNWRNKSPLSWRPYERSKRSASPSTGGSRRSRSRSPRHNYRGRYRNRSPPLLPPHSRSRSRDRDRKDSPPDGALEDVKSTNPPAVQSAIVLPNNNNGGGGGGNSSERLQSKRRCRDYDEKGFCMQGELCPFDHGVDPVVLEDTALSRVLYAPNAPGGGAGGGGVSGGPPPRGQEGILGPPPQNVVNIQPPLMQQHHRPNSNNSGPAEYNPQAPQMWHHGRPQFRGGHRGGLSQGPPRMPMGPFSGGPPMGTMPMQQRELISVPVMDNSGSGGGGGGGPPTFNPHHHHRGGGGGDYFGGPHHPYHNNHHNNGVHHHHNQQQQQDGFNNNNNNNMMNNMGGPGIGGNKKKFDFNRLGPRQKNTCNCSLELKKVPPGLNNITHLNNHFSKFGKIVNIQVYYEGDPEAAIVTFSSHAEAHAAYRSTEAVLNNRFIKVFWHSSNPSGSAPNGPPGSASLPSSASLDLTTPTSAGGTNAAKSVKERLGLGSQHKFINQNQTLTTTKTSEKENSNLLDENNLMKDSTEVKQEEIKAIKKNQELLAAKEKLKKNQEEKRKEALKLTQDLRKRKQELLEKQLAQQKLLIEKMEKSPQGVQRDLLMQTIKKSQESIEAIRKDLSSHSLSSAATAAILLLQPSGQKTSIQTQQQMALLNRETIQKELLDAELDLMTKQAEGADTVELQKRLWELRARAQQPNSRLNMRGAGARLGGGGRRFNPLQPVVMHRHKLSKNNLAATMEGVASKLIGSGGVGGGVGGGNVGSQLVIQGGGVGVTKVHQVDHRPTKLLVSGYEIDEQSLVLRHFGQFGEVVDFQADSATPSIVLNYKSRKEAEIAFAKGKFFQDRTLSITWSNQHQQQLQQNQQQLTLKTTTGGDMTTLSSTTTSTTLTNDTSDLSVIGTTTTGGAKVASIEEQNNDIVDVADDDDDDNVVDHNDDDGDDDGDNNVNDEEDRLIDGDVSGLMSVDDDDDDAGDEDGGPELSEEVLLQDDEEEEEENEEDRSWRR